MKVLIIGGLGYIGSALLIKLHNENIATTVIDINVRGTRLMNNLIHEYIEKDIRDINIVDMLNYDMIIYLAGVSLDLERGVSRDFAHDINIAPLERLAEIIKDTDIKLIYASSCSVYGNNVDNINELLTESSPVNPNTAYAKTKAKNEKIIESKVSNYQIVRSGTVFGRSNNMRDDLILNKMIKSKLSNRQLMISNHYRAVTYIDFLVDIYFKIIKEEISEKILNVVTANINLVEFAEMYGVNYRINNNIEKRNYKVTSQYQEIYNLKNIDYVLEKANEVSNIDFNNVGRGEQEFWGEKSIVNYRSIYFNGLLCQIKCNTLTPKYF